MKRFDLARKLVRIEALHEGATTPHERDAAARARERVLKRLVELGPLPCELRRPIPQEPVVLRDELPMPTRDEIRKVLTDWQKGKRSAMSVGRWASRVVDKVVLADVPADHPASIPAEVVLQLSCMERQPLTPDDVPALLAFLDAPADQTLAAWRTWFEHLAGIEWNARRAALAK